MTPNQYRRAQGAQNTCFNHSLQATQTTPLMGILKYIVFDMDDQYFG